MIFFDAPTFTSDRPWGAVDVAQFGPATVRVHWTDAPYRWHVNGGTEVLAVLQGAVDVHHEEDGARKVRRLHAGQVCCIGAGEAHVVQPAPVARLLIVETDDPELACAPPGTT